MFVYETDVFIKRPVDHVFAYVTSVDAISQWQPNVLGAVQTKSGPFGVGTTIVETTRTPFGNAQVSWKVVAYEPDHCCRYTSDSVLGQSNVTFSVEGTSGGTLLTVHGVGRLRGIFVLLQPLLGRLALFARRRELARIKLLMEGEELAIGS